MQSLSPSLGSEAFTNHNLEIKISLGMSLGIIPDYYIPTGKQHVIHVIRHWKFENLESDSVEF